MRMRILIEYISVKRLELDMIEHTYSHIDV